MNGRPDESDSRLTARESKGVNPLLEKVRSLNIDMWQKFHDCDMEERGLQCSASSSLNRQGVMLDLVNRNLLVGFNKRLVVFRFEKHSSKLAKNPDSIARQTSLQSDTST
jgi:hypothetical protein